MIRKPYRASYERALGQLRAEGIGTLVTGDIDQVGGAPNWIAERARPFDLEIFAPLWQRSRIGILQALIRFRFETIVSCVDDSKLGPEWLSRRLDPEALRDLRGVSRSAGIDPTGEQGEYHTITL
ncbi:ATP-binding protein, partial [mine drainage metagenome]